MCVRATRVLNPHTTMGFIDYRKRFQVVRTVYRSHIQRATLAQQLLHVCVYFSSRLAPSSFVIVYRLPHRCSRVDVPSPP